MSLKKIISTASRDIRSGEKNGVDYYFMPKENILFKKDNDELLQFVDFNGSLYGYEYSEFDNVDHLIIVCGGSGTGKDTIFNSFLEETDSRFKNKKYKFLFSVPETLPIFIDYAKEQNIQTSVIYLKVSEEERMKRIIRGTMIDNPFLSNKYQLKSFIWFPHINKTNDKLDCQIIYFEPNTSDINSEPETIQIVNDARERVLRDRKNPFDDGVKIQKDAGYDIQELDLSDSNLPQAIDKVFKLIYTIKVKEQDIPLKTDIGNINPFYDENILCAIPTLDRSKFLNSILSLEEGSVFESLRKAGIDTSSFEQTYLCPYSGLEFYSLVPMFLISNDLSLYIKRTEFNDMAFDKEWMWDRQDPNNLFNPSDLNKSMLGSGYTYGCNISDGSNQYLLVAIELDNGDKLICLTWEWFNK